MENTPMLSDPPLEKTILDNATDATLRKMPAVLVGGFVSAGIGAAIWAYITHVTEGRYGYIAGGIGLLVGLTLRIIVDSRSRKLGIIAALFAFGGTLLGNLMITTVVIADVSNLTFLDLWFGGRYNFIKYAFEFAFNVKSLFFYILAMYAAFFMANGE